MIKPYTKTGDMQIITILFILILYIIMHFAFSMHMHYEVCCVCVTVIFALILLKNIKKITEEKNIKKIYTIICCLLFFLLSCVAISNHEVWMDEAQAFLLSRESNNIYELFNNTKSEGHPILWHVMIFPLVHIFKTLESIQYLHVCISLCAIFILIKYSPFPTKTKILLIFGYYLFYEYNIISRNYSIGVLCIFFLATLYNNRYKNFFVYGLLVLILANTSPMGLIFTIGIVFTETVFFAINNRHRDKKIAIIIIGTIGIFVCLAQILRAKVGININSFDFENIVKPAIYSLFPIPNTQFSFWGTNILVNNKITYYMFFCLYTLLTVISIYRLIVVPQVLTFFAITTFGYFVFFSNIYYCNQRHFGFLFIATIFTEWIFKNSKEYTNNYSKFLNIHKIYTVAMHFVLVLHFCYTVLIFTMDNKYEFSASKSVSNFLINNKYNTYKICAYPDKTAIGVIAYSNIKCFYSLNLQKDISYIPWDEEKLKNTSLESALTDIDTLKEKYKKLVFISNQQLPDIKKHKLMFASERQICPDETEDNIFVYIYE